MFGAQLPDGQAGRLVAELKKRNIHISQRGNALRFAPYLHVADHDLARFMDSLSELLE
jgi:4-aminobutyrate aminotransferase-like enzyme